CALAPFVPAANHSRPDPSADRRSRGGKELSSLHEEIPVASAGTCSLRGEPAPAPLGLMKNSSARALPASSNKARLTTSSGREPCLRYDSPSHVAASGGQASHARRPRTPQPSEVPARTSRSA